MPKQTAFKNITEKSLSLEEFTAKENILREIVQNLVKAIPLKSQNKLIKILKGKYQPLSSGETANQKPEEFTKENIIETLLEKVLDYDIRNRSKSRGETILSRPGRKHEIHRFPDYEINIKNGILIEAEPFGKNLNDKGSGTNQVYEWLDSITTKSDIGIATNGFVWDLFYRDKINKKVSQVKEIDLRSIFLELFNETKNQVNLTNFEDEAFKVINEFYYAFSSKYVYKYIDDYVNLVELKREEVTSSFYKDFLKLIFGYVEIGKEIKKIDGNNYLIANITPKNDDVILNKFAIIFMNRLFFIKFMEDKDLIEKSFLNNLWKKYCDSGIVGNFYKSYIMPIFYNVLNTPVNQRIKNLYDEIPYLNGGLFRENIENEKNYNIADSIIKNIIDFLDRYTFKISRSQNDIDKYPLNPDILGNIYEKTVNLLTQGQKSKLGAYYTPENVTAFIVDNTLYPMILRKLKSVFKDEGWKDKQLERYKSLEDMFNPEKPITKDTMTFNRVVEALNRISVLDPACGSGHFLIETLERMSIIEKQIYKIMGQDKSEFDIKKDIIINNIFGVDVDPTAVEITKLRLWLSLIENLETSNPNQVEILPNIEYKILQGNSLTGISEVNQIKQIISLDPAETASKLNELEKLKNEYSRSEDYNESNMLRKEIHDKFDDLNLYLSGKQNNQPIKSFEDAQGIELHWPIVFYDTFSKNAGFNLIIGNPPYGNLLSDNQKKIVKIYSASTKEIAGAFVDRCIDILSNGGTLSYIITFAITFNKYLSSTRKKIVGNFEEAKIYSFDRDKCRIFSTMSQSVSIMICDIKHSNASGKIYTSKFLRTQPEDFTQIETQEANRMLLMDKSIISNNFNEKQRLPKLGDAMLVHILNSLFKNKNNMSDLLQLNQNKVTVWYRNTGNYWYNAWDQKPYDSKDIKSIEVPKEYASFLISVINSSLFYSYLRVYGDGRHLNMDILKSFPIPEYDRIINNSSEIDKMKDRLMVGLSSVFDKSQKKFYTSKIKRVIDECDKLLCTLYGIDETEYDYIINYDSEIRNTADDST